MKGLLDRKNEDVSITRKLPNGASVTYKSPNGSQVDMNGILGGMVDGYTPTPVSDNKQINVTPGEFVVNQPAAQKYKELLEKINNEGRRELAMGGWTGQEGKTNYYGGGDTSDPTVQAAVAMSQKYGVAGTDMNFHLLEQMAKEAIRRGINPLSLPQGQVYGLLEEASGFINEQQKKIATQADWSEIGTQQGVVPTAPGQPSAKSFYEGDYQVPAGGLNRDPRLPRRGDPQGFWTGGEVEGQASPGATPEEGDTFQTRGQTFYFKDGQWQYKGGAAAPSYAVDDLNTKTAAPKTEDQVVASDTAPTAQDATGLKLKEGESKNYGWANRAINAEKTIRELAAKGFNPAGLGMARQDMVNWLTNKVVPGKAEVGEDQAGDVLRSEDAQRYRRAVEAFVAAVLRKDTGAQIARSEYERVLKEMFPSTGSTEKTQEQLAEQRKQAIDAFIVGAGPAASILREKEEGLYDTEAVSETPWVTGEDVGGVIGSGVGAVGGALIGKSPTAAIAGSTALEQLGSAGGRAFDEWMRGGDDVAGAAVDFDKQDVIDGILTAGTAGLGSVAFKSVGAAKAFVNRELAKRGLTVADIGESAADDIAKKLSSRAATQIAGKVPDDIAAKYGANAGWQAVSKGGNPYFVNQSGKVINGITGRPVSGRNAKNIADLYKDPGFATGGLIGGRYG